MLLAGTTLAFATPSAFAFFTPESGGSPDANQINDLYKIVGVFALVIFVVVEGALAYALVRYRARKGAVAAQIRGNTRLEVGWTVGAAGILLVLAIITFAYLPSIIDAPDSLASGDSNGRIVNRSGLIGGTGNVNIPPDHKALTIIVNGRQYIWQYIYPGANNPDGLGAPYAYYKMLVPTGTTVILNIESQDVVHSWWIPQLGGKFQAVPGYHNYAWFRIAKPGVYKGQCAEICGQGHARMIAEVEAVPPAQFNAWLVHQKQLIAQANRSAAIRRQHLSRQQGPAQVE